MIQDFERFQDELDALRKVFGSSSVHAALPRLREIYYYTEEKWHAYVKQVPEGVVRYVLIAEAPPWSHDGTPKFLLDPASRIGPYMGALRQAFPQARRGSSADTLKVLAGHGFLLLDSIPFAMKYPSKERSSQKYVNLLRLTTKTYLQAKIDASRLTWAPGLRVAFAVSLNARAIVKASGGQLSFGGNLHPVSTDQIAVNGAGYPDCKKLRYLYEIDRAG
jgi:hypothetical protein